MVGLTDLTFWYFLVCVFGAERDVKARIYELSASIPRGGVQGERIGSLGGVYSKEISGLGGRMEAVELLDDDGGLWQFALVQSKIEGD